ncbi:MAG: hypothetical protein LBC02_14265 [Planctomycetaceae bacterium]|jgi:hypothetical protein|nr:hypothetical protein [Planctomycetaceae bacterium]
MTKRAKNCLLVEGSDDIHVVSELLNQHKLTSLRNEKDKSINPLKLNVEINSLSKELDIESETGIVNILEKFESLINVDTNELDAIGVILDFDSSNDEQSNNRNIAVETAINAINKNNSDKNSNKWNIPNNFSILNQSGFIANPNSNLKNVPKIGVWLMPDNQHRGMLETFLQHLVPESQQKLLDYASAVTDKAKKNYAASYKDCHKDKAIVHTFLSWMDEPGKPFGISFKNKSFDANSPLALKFIEWIKELFS